jgi:hypothetical protein
VAAAGAALHETGRLVRKRTKVYERHAVIPPGDVEK